MSKRKKSEIYRVPSDDFIVDDYEDEMYEDDVNKRSFEAILKLPKKEKDEFLSIRDEMDNEVPTIEKIMSSNITRNDKKQCLRLLDQMTNTDEYSAECFRLIDSINEILWKGKNCTKEEIKFLESEEERLQKLYVSTDSLKTKILKLQAETHIKAKLLKMYDEMMTYPTDSSTYTSLKEEIEWSIRMPYQKRDIDAYVNMNNQELNKFYCSIRQKLDEELYGMDKVKNRIIHVLNDRKSSQDTCGRNIALVGNPGTGKTAVCKALAKILGKKFAKISAGSLDSAAIKGSNKVYVSSAPSIILQKMADLKTNNMVMMIDEPDKMDIRGQHALLHVSDPSDNDKFQDAYLQNFSHDLSKVLFIYCMNDDKLLDAAFRDRLDIIYVDDYNNDEKLEIFKNYMLPKALVNIGMKKNDVVVTDSAVKKLLKDRHMGLRNMEKIIKDIIGKINMYKNVILPDGTTGNLKLEYQIPNFKLPLKIDNKLLHELL